MAWSNNLFYIVFLSQIFLISYYIPRKILERMQHVLTTYPPSEYPKLYPLPSDQYETGQAKFRFWNRIAIAIGFLTLFLIMFVIDHSTFADDGYISEMFPLGYGMIQFLPLMMLEFSEFSHLKLMRKMNANPKRKADLRRRRLRDVVSPKLLGFTLLIMAACIFYDFYVHNFVFSWGHDSVQRTITLLITNAFFVAVGSWQLYGQKLDPHQAPSDRMLRAGASVKSMFYVSIAMSVFFITVAADDVYDMDFLDAILLSAYFQVIALLSIGSILRSVRPDDIDFDVYKSDATAT